MSGVVAVPEAIAAAAEHVAGIGSSLDAAHAAAAAPTISLAPAAADDVSTGISQLFSQLGQQFQAVSGQAGTILNGFVQNLNANSLSYLMTEASNIGQLTGSAVVEAASDPAVFLAKVWHAFTNPVISLADGLYALAYLTYGIAYFNLLLAWLALQVGAFLIRIQLSAAFHITLPASFF